MTPEAILNQLATCMTQVTRLKKYVEIHPASSMAQILAGPILKGDFVACEFWVLRSPMKGSCKKCLNAEKNSAFHPTSKGNLDDLDGDQKKMSSRSPVDSVDSSRWWIHKWKNNKIPNFAHPRWSDLHKAQQLGGFGGPFSVDFQSWAPKAAGTEHVKDLKNPALHTLHRHPTDVVVDRNDQRLQMVRCSVPSGNFLHSYWKWPSRNSGFTHWKWWFSIVM